MPSEKSDSTNITVDELLEKFSSGSERQKRRLLTEVESRSEDLIALGPNLLKAFDTLLNNKKFRDNQIFLVKNSLSEIQSITNPYDICEKRINEIISTTT